MKQTLSFAVAALIYSASATQVNQMTSLATQAAVSDAAMGWCDMNQQQRAAWIKAQDDLRKKKIATARSNYKAGHKKVRADYNSSRAEALAEYKEKRAALTKAALEKAGVTSVKKLPKKARRALKIAIRKERKAYFEATKPARDEYIKGKKALSAAYSAAKKSAEEGMKADIEAFKKTQEECDAMESSSDDEPVTESESEEPVTESESEEPETESEESEESDEEVTLPKKVVQECTGAMDRLTNEQTANLFEIAKQKSGVYQDVSFPADNTSLWWDKAQPVSIGQNWKQRNNIQWKRAFELKQGTLWGSKGILPAGVRQGGLGDCWWVAVASALAEWPERIEKVFKNYDQDKGIYEFEMWRKGEPVKVVVDDRLPAVNGRYTQMAGQSRNGAWWLPLLEKAAAKYWGRYERMHGGNGWEAFNQLTGYPSSGINIQRSSEQEILEFIKMADDKHNVMWGHPALKEQGLVTAHLYSVLGHTRWNGMDFVQWRNPWGSGEYKGPWSDNDKTTNPNQLANFRAHVLKYENHESSGAATNDGKFWMALSDVKKYMGGVTAGYYLDDYHLTSFNPTIQAAEAVHEFTLNNPVSQRVVIQSDSIHRRQLMDSSTPCQEALQDYKYWPVEMYVDNQRMRTTNDGWGRLRDFNPLPAGQYKILAKKNNKSSAESYKINVNAWAAKQATTIA